MNGLAKMIDQGAWVFFTWRTLWEALELREGKGADNQSVLELILTHPQPGPRWENEKITQPARSWFTFLCAFKRTMPNLKTPRDIRLKIRNMIFPSADDFIYLVPTKNLSHYAWIFNKKQLLSKLVERHLRCARNLKPSKKEIKHLLPQVPADVLDFFDAEKREAIIKPLLEKSYEKFLGN